MKEAVWYRPRSAGMHEQGEMVWHGCLRLLSVCGDICTKSGPRVASSNRNHEQTSNHLWERQRVLLRLLRNVHDEVAPLAHKR
jgi:hypothetical protein